MMRQVKTLLGMRPKAIRKKIQGAPVRAYVAGLCVALMAAPAGFGQQAARSNREPSFRSEPGFINRLTNKYRAGTVPPVDISNSNRLEQLIRAGNLYLTLNDTIALALENNLALESQRYQFQLTDVAYKSSLTGPNGSWDPAFTATQGYRHAVSQSTNTQTNNGVQVGINDTQQRDVGITQSFATGGSLTVGLANQYQKTNGTTLTLNPTYTSGLSLAANQPLLNGFGFAYNRRNIYIAKNNQRAADFTFQTNINTTLNTVIQAYWNLLTATLNVDVVRTSLAQAEKLSSDNRKQVQIGTLAENDVVNSDANVATAQGNLITAQAAVLTQEATLKNLLSRNGLASATLASVHIVPIDRVHVPDVEPVQPIQDLTEMAIAKRPELGSLRITLENNEIQIKAAKNQLLPTITLNANVNNPGTAGTKNLIDTGRKDPLTGEEIFSAPLPELVGSYGNILRQLFYVPLISYSFSVNVNIPLRNRAQQYAYETQALTYRQNELALQNQINQIRLDVQTAQINIETARQRYAVAVTQSALNAQVLDNEQKKLALGASTTYQVIQYQTQLLTSRQNELSAQVAYANAKLAMDVATSNLMDKYNITFDDAKAAQLSRRPDPIPDLVAQPAR